MGHYTIHTMIIVGFQKQKLHHIPQNTNIHTWNIKSPKAYFNKLFMSATVVLQVWILRQESVLYGRHSLILLLIIMIILIMQECAKGVGEPCKNQIWNWPGHLYDYSRKGTKGICAPGLRKGFLSITFTDKIHMSQ